MKNQLLRIIAVAIVASLVLISWMKSRSDDNASYESDKVEIIDSQETSTAELNMLSLDEAKI
jgi:hypothetical protein